MELIEMLLIDHTFKTVGKH